jgi:hypothetical protein
MNRQWKHMGVNSTYDVGADHKDRRIVLWKEPGSNAPTHPLQLFESMLWALRGATRSNWDSVPLPDLADVIVLHEADRSERLALWQRAGKIVIVIVSQVDMSPTGEYALAYPFRVAQVQELLNALDRKLTTQSGGTGIESARAPTDDVDPCRKDRSNARTVAESRLPRVLSRP